MSRKYDNPRHIFTNDPKKIVQADFSIICVPTPVTKIKEPDLYPVESAAATVEQNLKRGAVVILESTVYPGVTEETMGPILEKESGLKCGQDFKIGYAPERVNPGDKEHTIDKIYKVVSGMDDETRDLVAEIYSRIIPNIFKARNIQTAEAAKVIENIQRDLNIALMNELSLIFEKLHLDTKEVLDAAGTKWNFHHYSPGLVGGHCIPVDPYYLVRRAKEFGYHSQVIAAGRAINDSMAKHVAEMTVKALNEVGKVIKGSRVLIIGLTYKENVPDTRETPQKHAIEELKEYGIVPFGYDPLLDIAEAEKEFGIKMLKTPEQKFKFDAIILAMSHDIFKGNGHGLSLEELQGVMNSKPVLMDIRRHFDGNKAMQKGFCYRTLKTRIKIAKFEHSSAPFRKTGNTAGTGSSQTYILDVNSPGDEPKSMNFSLDNTLPDSETRGVLIEMWQEVCRGGGSLSFKILSASMRPTIEVGDVIRVGEVEPSRVRVGDILAFQDGQNVVVHRISGKNRSGDQIIFHHGGDAGGLSGEITAQHLIGKVLAVKRGGREISLDTLWFTVSNRVLGWRLHFVDTLSCMRPGLTRTVIHQALRLPWKLGRSIFQRPFTGKES